MDLNVFYDKAWSAVLFYGPRVLLAVIFIIAGQWLIKTMRGWITRILLKRKIDQSLRSFLISLLGTVMQVLLVIAIMQVLGVQMTIFAALIGGIGVAIGLALSGTMQNFTSGLLILLLKPYKVGDNIRAQGQEGTISSIQIFYTIMTTFDNLTVVIPNSKLSNELIVNMSCQGTRRLDIELKFPFSVPYDQIADAINKSITGDPVLPTPPLRIGVIAIENDGYKIAVQMWIKEHGFTDTKLALQKKIIDGIVASGLKIPGM